MVTAAGGFLLTLILSLWGTYWVVNENEKDLKHDVLDKVSITENKSGTYNYDWKKGNKGINLEYKKYRDVVDELKSGEFTLSKNGIVKRSEVFGVNFYWIFDYSWLAKDKVSNETIQKYIEENKGLMIVRTFWLSGSLIESVVFISILFICGGYCNKLLLRLLPAFIAKRGIILERGSDPEMVESAYRSLLKRRVATSNELKFVLIVYGSLTALIGVLSVDKVDNMGVAAVVAYLVIDLIVVGYLAFDVKRAIKTVGMGK
ncbi:MULTISPECIES: hypothetical protein [Bacillus amyloliquefaciens group]|uniref:hypothetical protein n=1 Tax=Bacillus amyloliquefaciens group TaxID=1938374 RepID=UPI00073C5DF1|nr:MULTISPECIES: hypothetical protein [Bacillus amyloliquefaciens group]KTF59743.1 hypothetical protein AR691_13500 [Bacillus amyloliquefaciens]